MADGYTNLLDPINVKMDYLNPYRGISSGLMTNPLVNPGLNPKSTFVAPDRWSWDGFFGKTDPATGHVYPGWGGTAINGLSQLGSGWLAMKNYGLAKDQLSFQKDAFNRNFAMQQKDINRQLENQVRAANAAAGPNNQINLEDYMRKYGV